MSTSFLPSARLDIRIFDVSGREVYRRSDEAQGESEVRINVETLRLATGPYLVRVMDTSGAVASSCFVKSY